jgi:hypothetical protein
MCGILEEPGETKERWPYLRAALSSTINYTDSQCAAIMPYSQLHEICYTAIMPDYLNQQQTNLIILYTQLCKVKHL